MKNLRILVEPAIWAYDCIGYVKQGPRAERLKNLRPRVASRYEKYLELSLELESIPDSPFENDEDRAALLHCYNAATQPLDELTTRIVLAQDTYGRCYCAYCGINSPGTIDHYAPQDLFPEFAVCHHNMLPCCGECNSKKGIRWREFGLRKIIHLYFDQLPTTCRWLFADIDVIDGVPIAVFSLRKPEELSDRRYLQLASHYNLLQLLPRYTARAGEVFSEFIGFAKALGSIDAMYQMLVAHADATAIEHGVNFWKVALYKAAAESKPLAEMIASKYLGNRTRVSE